ncbi:MAG: EcsC family protein, partial [Coriobacteriales bacterium]|nr:EcsC family protein [Coriobacteriales bacterium]
MNEQAHEKRSPMIPKPILDDREYDELDELTRRYKKLTSPSPIGRAAKKAGAIVPAGVKDAVGYLGNMVSEQEIYKQALKLIGSGFKVLEEQAARVTVSEDSIIKNINAVSKAADIESIEEICRIRAYDVSKAANKNNVQHLLAALAEGGGTGVAGFAGIPFNLVLSTFIYYRAVQSIAMSYGYDIKNDPAELI